MHGTVKDDSSAPGRWRSLLTAAVSVIHNLPLFFAARPKTPLRVMCIMAFDTLHRLRYTRPLPAHRITALAALLDLGACANTVLDHKGCGRAEFRQTRRMLAEAGLRPAMIDYLRRLRQLERGRPLPGSDLDPFHAVRRYREDVVRLSLAMVATTANVCTSLDGAMRAIHDDADLNVLFRIVMQCQITDDVLDYRHDLAAGLPSFLTAGTSFPQALGQTRWAALAYADLRDVPNTADAFPFSAALSLASVCTRQTIALGRWRWGHAMPQDETVRLTHPQCTLTSAMRSSN